MERNDQHPETSSSGGGDGPESGRGDQVGDGGVTAPQSRQKGIKMTPKIKVHRHYDGKLYEVDPPEWLQKKIALQVPFLKPGLPVRLVCSDIPSSNLSFLAYVPCNGGFSVQIDW